MNQIIPNVIFFVFWDVQNSFYLLSVYIAFVKILLHQMRCIKYLLQTFTEEKTPGQAVPFCLTKRYVKTALNKQGCWLGITAIFAECKCRQSVPQIFA